MDFLRDQTHRLHLNVISVFKILGNSCATHLLVFCFLFNLLKLSEQNASATT